MAEASLLKQVKLVDQLKIRGGYGVLGIRKLMIISIHLSTTGINYPDGDGELLVGVFPKNFASLDIRWEETKLATNVGIDFMAFRNRLSLTVDWYVKNTKDIYYLS